MASHGQRFVGHRWPCPNVNPHWPALASQRPPDVVPVFGVGPSFLVKFSGHLGRGFCTGILAIQVYVVKAAHSRLMSGDAPLDVHGKSSADCTALLSSDVRQAVAFVPFLAARHCS